MLRPLSEQNHLRLVDTSPNREETTISNGFDDQSKLSFERRYAVLRHWGRGIAASDRKMHREPRPRIHLEEWEKVTHDSESER